MFERILVYSVLLLSLVITCSWADGTLNYFPHKNELSIGFYNDHVLPDDISISLSPLVWKSNFKVQYGGLMGYQRLIYHTQYYLGIYWGGNLAWWHIKPDSLFALATYLELRVWPVHTRWVSPYVSLSIAGPTVLSRRQFGGSQLGARFIFQDFFGLGVLLGKNQQFDLNFRLYHYSNGDIFVHNDGLDVPFVLTAAWAF